MARREDELDRLQRALVSSAPAEIAGLLDNAKSDPCRAWLRLAAAGWAAERGLIPVLDWLRARGPRALYENEILRVAAMNGRVAVLDWLDADGFASAENCRRSGVLLGAVANDHFDVIDWLHMKNKLSKNDLLSTLLDVPCSTGTERQLIGLNIMSGNDFSRSYVARLACQNKFITLDWLMERGWFVPGWMGDIVARACETESPEKIFAWVSARADIGDVMAESSSAILAEIVTSSHFPFLCEFSCPETDRRMLLAVLQRKKLSQLGMRARLLVTRENCLADGAKILRAVARWRSPRGRGVRRQLAKRCRLMPSDFASAGLR